MAEYRGKYKSVYTPGVEFETDYVAREAARDLMYHNQGPLTEYDLDDLPSADVRPVVRGRWVNEEYISKQAAIDALGEEPEIWCETDEEAATRNQWERDKAAIELVPSVDVRPVVRCKDCMRYEFMSNRVPEEREWSCWFFGTIFGPDDFCSFGERREEDR